MYFGDLENLYPSYLYHLKVDGSGAIELSGSVFGTFVCPLDTIVSVYSAMGEIVLELLESKSTDPIHNMRFIMLGFEDVLEVSPYPPELVKFLVDFQVKRWSASRTILFKWVHFKESNK